MATITKNKGDSITIQIVVDSSITLANINELVVYLGDKLSAKKSVLGQLTQVDNVFTWKIPSSDTLYLSGINAVTVSLDYDGYGNRKTFQETAPKIQFLSNNNVFSDEAVSDDFADLVINLNLVTGTLTETQALYNWFSNTQTIDIVNKQDGDIITHNLNGHVTAEFFDSNYLYDERISIEYVTDSTVRFRTSVFADILNTPFNGKLRCTRI